MVLLSYALSSPCCVLVVVAMSARSEWTVRMLDGPSYERRIKDKLVRVLTLNLT